MFPKYKAIHFNYEFTNEESILISVSIVLLVFKMQSVKVGCMDGSSSSWHSRAYCNLQTEKASKIHEFISVKHGQSLG